MKQRPNVRAGWAGNPAAELAEVLLETYAVNDAMNQLLLEHLDPRAWRAKLPGQKDKGRTIAAIYAHLHNSRLVWLKRSAPHLKCPKPLDPDRCTMKQAAAAHEHSAEQCLRMLTDALTGGPKRRVRSFRVEAGRHCGRRAERCSRICFPTRRTIAGRFSCWLFSWDTASRRRFGDGSGSGTGYGSRRDWRRGRGRFACVE